MVGFDAFKNQAGLHTLAISVSEWIEKTCVIRLYVKRGKHGGTSAHKEECFQILLDIADYQLNILNKRNESK